MSLYVSVGHLWNNLSRIIPLSESNQIKDRILDRYGVPLLRLSTTGIDKEVKIHTQLTELLQR